MGGHLTKRADQIPAPETLKQTEFHEYRVKLPGIETALGPELQPDIKKQKFWNRHL